MVKAAFGGGGRGMRVVQTSQLLLSGLQEARAEAGASFGNDAVFLERYIRRARHIEVQILADTRGNILHLHERDCSVQRRNQKVVEVAPAVNLDSKIRAGLANAAVALARESKYYSAATVEFLVDADTGEWYFIEVNPRVQVEHTVTEMVTGIDIVQSQIQIAAEGYFAPRICVAMPGHDRRPCQRLPSRLRQASDLPFAGRFRHPSRWRFGVRRRRYHSVL
jgi:pyruvate carboxylase